MAAWYLPKSRRISTRDVLYFGEGRKPSAPAAVQQDGLGRARNLVFRFLVWEHRHLSGQFIRHTNFREFPRLLAEACGGQGTDKADRSAQLDARALQGWLEHEIPLGREACVREVAHNKCGSFVQQWVREVRRAVPSNRFLDRAGKKAVREHKLLESVHSNRRKKGECGPWWHYPLLGHAQLKGWRPDARRCTHWKRVGQHLCKSSCRRRCWASKVVVEQRRRARKWPQENFGRGENAVLFQSPRRSSARSLLATIPTKWQKCIST